MGSYIPGQGFKKPLNLLQNPIYPDIKATLPKFRWTGKFWNVDVGAALRDNVQNNSGAIEAAVLTQSRAYNSQNAYGVNSFKKAVNENFRPPLITQEDVLPLSRLPREITVPRINPSPGDRFQAQNNRPAPTAEIDLKKEGKISAQGWRPTFYFPFDLPPDNSILPDLESKLPAHAASAGYLYPSVDAPHQDVELEHFQLHPSFEAGMNVPMTFTEKGRDQELELYDNRPQVSASAGYKGYTTGVGDTVMDYDLQENRPRVSMTAGFNSQFLKDGDVPMDFNLEENRPRVSANAGFNSRFLKDGDVRTDFNLDEKMHEGPLSVRNAAPEYKDVSNSNKQFDPIKTSQLNRPNVSYQTTKNIPFQVANGTKPHYREKTSALAKYRGSNATQILPSRLSNMNVTLKSDVKSSKYKM